MTRTPAPTIVAVSDAELVAAVVQPGGIARLAERVEASGARVLAIGTDRFDPERGRGHRLDPSSAAIALGRALPTHGLLLAVAPTREHPYNVARRVLSLDHVLDARVGLIVGARDHGLPVTGARHDPIEFAGVVRGLWRTWPLDSIVGDRETGRFADTGRIRPLDHDGGPDGYRVRGPLTTPSSRQGEPVLALWHDVAAARTDQAGASPVGADLVLGGPAYPLAPLPADAGAWEPHRASRQPADAPPGTERPTLRALLGLRAPAPAPVPGPATAPTSVPTTVSA